MPELDLEAIPYEIYGLTELQSKAAAFIGAGASITNVATRCEVSRMTIYRWLKIPAFEAAINTVRLEHTTQIVNRLKHVVSDGLFALSAIINSEKSRPADVIAATAVAIRGFAALNIEGETEAGRIEAKRMFGG